MDIEKYTAKAQEAVQSAVQEATKRKHTECEPLHLLFVLVEQEGLAALILSQCGADASAVRDEAEAILAQRATLVEGASNAPSATLVQVLNSAETVMAKYNDTFTSIEHVLVALATVAGDARDILLRYVGSVQKITAAIAQVRGGCPCE